ncbi:disease resistance protein Pik-2-like [Hordeum vulgare subsp. vulgare]|uniref:AAA+ ATPase domain-containing protein n=1 Tax=Hordeum vulgare subsp. vulgare TaxID=112509 RepID=M0UMX3_HORVV|nr:disease resistance protein Pik-2-like [Hordeum vulgare subsp. vulgare]
MDLVVAGHGEAIEWLLTKLVALLAEDYTLIQGVRGDVQYITDELGTMHAFIGELCRTKPHGHDLLTRDWLKQIREVTYDIEDCVDDFAHRLHHDPTADLCCCSFVAFKIYEVLTWWPRHEIASTLSELKMRAQQIGERRIRYGLDNPRISSDRPGGADIGFNAAENQQTKLALVRTKTPVGVERDMEMLGKWMLTTEGPADTIAQQLPSSSTVVPVEEPTADPTNHGVLCIVGLAGIGKTTIARSLYQNFSDQFDRRAMVTVSHNSDVEAVLRSILYQIMPQVREGTSQQQWWDTSHGSIGGGASKKAHDRLQTLKLQKLKKELKEHLEKYSYLLVLDDVWSTDMLGLIKKSLPRSEKGSRVIVTSRFQAVASACVRNKGDCLYKAVILSENKSEELFMDIMAEAKGSQEQQDKSKVIPAHWEMCMSLPLAIVIMAGYVACNPHFSDWKLVCKNPTPDYLKPLSHGGLMSIIDNCYFDMPAEIKRCSLYLSIFPSGSQNSRKRILRKWISEALVSEKQGLSAEEVAEACFNHLMKRQIIRAVKHSSNGKVKIYEVHHMIHEYLVCKAAEENFVTVVGGQWLVAPSSNMVRRLSLQSDGLKTESAKNNMILSHVRSFSVFGTLNGLLSKPQKLRIVQHLDLEGCADFKQEHAKVVCELFLLKHLSLRRTDITKLPKEIGKLQYLETLDIRETGITKLPKTICKLEKVKNILGGNKKTRKALKLPGDMKKKPIKSLCVLSGIEIVEGPSSVADFCQLTKLRKLVIYKLNIKNEGKLFDELRSSIEDLCGYSLQTLVIDDGSAGFLSSWGDLSSPPKFLDALELSCKLQAEVVKLPKWIIELDTLTKLTLSVGMLSSDALVQLSQLRKLFSLTFSLEDAEQGSESEATCRQIQLHLEHPNITMMIMVPPGGFESLKLLRFSAPYVPRLVFLEKATPNLERLDLRFFAFEGVDCIEHLKVLKEMHFSLHNNGSKCTKKLIQQISNEVRQCENGPKLIVDQYH